MPWRFERVERGRGAPDSRRGACGPRQRAGSPGFRAISALLVGRVVGGAGAGARAAHGLVGVVGELGLLEHDDDLLQGALVGQALQPHVRACHLLAGPGAERGLALRHHLGVSSCVISSPVRVRNAAGAA